MMNDIDRILDLAFNAYNQNNFHEAEKLARTVLSLSSQEADALYLMGLIAFHNQVFHQAELFFTQAYLINSKNEQYALNLAFTLQKLGKLDQALHLYKSFPKNAEAIAQIGFIQILLNQISFAKNSFKQALILDPKNISSFIGKACIEKIKNNLQKSIQILSSIPVHNQESLFQLGLLYYEINDFKNARSYFNKALKFNEIDTIYLYLAQIELNLKNKNKALDYFNKGLSINSKNPKLLAGKAIVLQNDNKLNEAYKLFEQALSEDQNNISILHNFADLNYQLNHKAKALDYYQKVIQINPKYLPSLYNLAIILEETEQFDEALGLYFNIKVLKGEFDDLSPRIQKCIISLYKKNKKQAINFLKGWVKNYPDDLFAQFTYNYLIKGKHENLSEYISLLYQKFASSYDKQMELLEAKSITNIIKNLPEKFYDSILDLGCGSGLFAKKFKGHFKSITGVDISQEMLNKAKETHLYNHLIKKDIFHYLNNNEKKFDLIVMSEVFCYIEKPEEIFKLIYQHMNKNTVFAFTTETTENKKTSLSLYGHFQHSNTAIEEALLKNNLNIVKKVSFPLRKEKDTFLPGTLFITKLF